MNQGLSRGVPQRLNAKRLLTAKVYESLQKSWF